MKNLLMKNLLLLILIIKVISFDINPKFSSHIITSKIDKAFTCNKNNVTLIKTIENEIFISLNNGFSWENISRSFEKTGEKVALKKKDVGKVEKIIQSQYLDNQLFFIGSNDISWVSSDCGISLKAYNYGEKISDVLFHPLNTDWVLATALSISNNNSQTTYDVFLSKNAGYTWKHLINNVNEVSWGCRNRKQLEKGISKQRIIVSVFNENNSIDLIFSDDLFISKTVSLTNIKDVYANDFSIYVSKINSVHDKVDKRLDVLQYSKDSVSLYYSSLDVFSLSFKPIVINSNPNSSILDFKFYSINEKDEEVVLSLKQYYLTTKTSISNLYISKLGNEIFNGNIENVSGISDPSFIEINELEGVYLAHRLMNESLQTVISFNSGSHWHLITNLSNALTFNFQDKNYQENLRKLCKNNDCHLNLTNIRQMENMNIGTLLSNGFISNLDYSLERKYNLFISKDAGLTWNIIFEGETVYQISNSVIVISSKDFRNKLYYSTDSGETFSLIDIGVENMTAESILLYNQTKFIIIGFNDKNGVVVGLDFSNQLEICLEEDYEKWSPYRSIGTCVNGENLEFKRKNPNSSCLDNYGIQLLSSKPCFCTEADYFCDIGYKRQFNSGPCVKNFEYKKEVEKCSNYITKGYLIIPKNECINGVDLNPSYQKIKNCELSEMPLMMIISIILIVFVFIITFYISKFIEKNNRFSKNYKNSSEMESINNDLNRSIEMTRKKSESTFGSKYELEEDSE